MRCLEGTRRVVVVGIPGVGKTTLLRMVVDKLRTDGKQVSMHNFGTLMLDVARQKGITDRDLLRNLPTHDQILLQKAAAEHIVAHRDDIIVIDTHAFVNTRSGYYPGLPNWVLDILKPDGYILLYAKPEEIYNRRMNDPTRHRDHITLLGIKQELNLQVAMVAACSVISGAPLKPIMNRQDRMHEAVDVMIGAMGEMNK